MKELTLLTLAAALLTGCATSSHVVNDIRDPDGTTTITTTTKSRSFLASKADLTNVTSKQDETTQEVDIGGMSQEADASDVVGVAVQAAIKAAVESAK